PILVATLSLPALLRSAAPAPALPGQSVSLLDGEEAAVASYRSGFDATALPGQVLDIATEGAHESDGLRPLRTPGLEGWQVVVSAPIPLAAMPLPAIGTLAALFILLFGLPLWMCCTFIRPQ